MCARTPVIELVAGSLGVTAALALKLESLQVSGTFKGRGAFHKLLASKVPAAGIIAASGGNHGAAAAYAARALGHKAEIFVPTIASPAKVARLRSYGAVVNQVGAVYAEARAASEARAAETGALMVPAYEDEVVFAGAGSVALEFAEQAEFDTLLIAVGGGGLIAGCAAAIGSAKKIVAVETEGTPTLHEALKAGKPVDVAISGIAADALGASRIGTPNFELRVRWSAAPCWSPTRPCARRSARCGTNCASLPNRPARPASLPCVLAPIVPRPASALPH